MSCKGGGGGVFEKAPDEEFPVNAMSSFCVGRDLAVTKLLQVIKPCMRVPTTQCNVIIGPYEARILRRVGTHWNLQSL